MCFIFFSLTDASVLTVGTDLCVLQDTTSVILPDITVHLGLHVFLLVTHMSVIVPLVKLASFVRKVSS